MSPLYAELPRPFLALAPMEDVTDPVFRSLVSRAAAPDLLFSEFTSAAGIVADRPTVVRRLRQEPGLPPLVVQIWGNDPETNANAVRMLRRRGVQAIDINMGCPQPKITRKGRCAALIRQPELASAIVRAVTQAAREPAVEPPMAVSVKTRIGFSEPAPHAWLGLLLDLDLDALHVHFRTVSDMSEVPARWEFADVLLELRDRLNPRTAVTGNGDILDSDHAVVLHARYGLDGYLIGRGIFASPWAFAPGAQSRSPEERIRFALAHTNAHKDFYPGTRSFPVLKKFYKAWADCFVGAKALRDALMDADSHEEAEQLLVRALELTAGRAVSTLQA